jgi:signal transduction histidine kinase
MLTKLQASLLPGGTGGFEDEHRLVVGPEVRWVHARGRTLFEGEGVDRRAVSALGAVIDVTERRRHEEELLQALRARDELISLASHELRTPLMTLDLRLRQVTQLLKREAPQERLFEVIDGAHRQVSRLSRLIDAMLEVSRISTGRFTLLLEAVDLAALAREAVDRVRDVAAQSGASLELETPPSLVGCWDRSRLDTLLHQLLTNAIKFGGGQTVSVRIVDEDPRGVRIEVRDRGSGLSEGSVARMFQKFGRGVAPKGYGGLGLGLYLARAIAQAHGGEIGVESEPGRGATFRVTLPRERAA